jgi:hypothetical protein
MTNPGSFAKGAASVVLAGWLPWASVAASESRKPAADPVAASRPVALYITLCLWSEQRSPTCRELPLTPGPAGPMFATMADCQDGQAKALHRWLAEAGPVFGITAMAGDGYRIEARRCAVIDDATPPR